MIKNVIFDCSNTLLAFPIVELVATQTGDYDHALRICNAILNDQVWGDFDNGKISEADITDAALALLAEEDRIYGQFFLDHYVDCFTLIEGIPEFLADLKAKGYRLFVLSDFPTSFERLRAKFDIFQLFDEVVVSYQEGVSKRDRKLFPHLLSAYDLDPDECLFFDDIAKNIAAAEAVGIHGVVFTDVAAARAAIGL